jgi:hypothetical protein
MITKKQLVGKKFNISKFISEQDEEDFDNQNQSNDEEGDTNVGDFVDMMSALLNSQTQVHVFHLQTESYAEHKALQNYYEGIDGIVDGLVESFQGKYQILKNYRGGDIYDWKSTDETIKYLKNLCAMVEEKRNCCKDSYIQNQIDTVCELINSTTYKLRFLK